MATSDVFKKRDRGSERVTYAIIGGGINFTFPSGLYEPQDAEAMAIARAKALQCHLYCKDSKGAIYQVYPDNGNKGRIGIGHRRFDSKAYPEMLSNEPFVPGIQVSSY